jgi:hypothetical protein
MEIKIIQWIPLIVAFTAGGFALRQIRSNNITNARIKWLDNLKQILTDFFSECAILQLKQGLIIGIDEQYQTSPMEDSIRSYYSRIAESTFEHLKLVSSKYDLIKFNLSPKEALHLKLEKLLDTYMELFNEMPKHKTTESYNALTRKMSAYSDTIVLLARYVMKIEWEKTKRHYISRIYFMKLARGRLLLKEALGLELLPERKPLTN